MPADSSETGKQDRCTPPRPGEEDSAPHAGMLSPVDLLNFGLEEAGPPENRPPPLLGELQTFFPDFRLLEVLGEGGMGSVLLAIEEETGNKVAIKTLPEELIGNPEFEERFLREADSISRLSHPHIISISRFDRTEKGQFYFVMEHVDGNDLSIRIKDTSHDSIQFLRWVNQIASALDYAHRMGFIHRDIKPANILIGQDGLVKVADFGLAKLMRPSSEEEVASMHLTLTGLVLGTPDYMSPEQLKGSGSVDHRSDIFSLGIVLHEVITGTCPKGAYSPPSEKWGCDPRIDTILLSALNPDPDRRYQKVADFRTDLEKILPKTESNA